MNESHQQAPKVCCTLKGKIIGRQNQDLMLHKWTDFSRKEKNIIPIKNGRFEYQLENVYTEMYTLSLTADKEINGHKGLRMIRFFPEEGEIVFKIHSDEQFGKDTISGGPVNAELKAFNDARKSIFGAKSQAVKEKARELFEGNRYLSEAMNALYKATRNAKDDQTRLELSSKMEAMRKGKKDLTPEGVELEEAQKVLHAGILDWKSQYIDEHITYVSFFTLAEHLRMEQVNKFKEYKILSLSDVTKKYEKLAQKFPLHPYTYLIGKILEGKKAIKVGADLVDFTAPDLEGNNYQFSSLAKGKVVLLDLWSTTCGSCIRKSRTMIPVYRDFKDKGFTVVGVAREFGNTNELFNRLEKEKFPWINLIDLEDQQKIWLKYNIPFSSGGTFLIDEKGKILDINPTAGSIRKILEAKVDVKKK